MAANVKSTTTIGHGNFITKLPIVKDTTFMDINLITQTIIGTRSLHYNLIRKQMENNFCPLQKDSSQMIKENHKQKIFRHTCMKYHLKATGTRQIRASSCAYFITIMVINVTKILLGLQAFT